MYARLGDCEVVEVKMNRGNEETEMKALLESYFASFVNLGAAGIYGCICVHIVCITINNKNNNNKRLLLKLPRNKHTIHTRTHTQTTKPQCLTRTKLYSFLSLSALVFYVAAVLSRCWYVKSMGCKHINVQITSRTRL